MGRLEVSERAARSGCQNGSGRPLSGTHRHGRGTGIEGLRGVHPGPQHPAAAERLHSSAVRQQTHEPGHIPAPILSAPRKGESGFRFVISIVDFRPDFLFVFM